MSLSNTSFINYLSKFTNMSQEVKESLIKEYDQIFYNLLKKTTSGDINAAFLEKNIQRTIDSYRVKL